MGLGFKVPPLLAPTCKDRPIAEALPALAALFALGCPLVFAGATTVLLVPWSIA